MKRPGERERLPLSYNQKRLWVISQLNSSDPTYNIQLAYHIHGLVDMGILTRSLELLVEKHHTLFSVFNHDNGEPYLELKVRPVAVEFIDFSKSQNPSRREEILNFAGDQSRVPFDIAKGPLFRFHLLKESDDSFFFCAIIHHIVFDGFSRRIFVQELSEIYSELIRGINTIPKPLKLHSYDLAAFENSDTLPLAKKEESVNFWKNKLDHCPPELKFPFDYPRPIRPSGMGRRESFSFSAGSSQRLREISQESACSLFNVLLTVIGVYLHKSTGEDDICMGIPVANRRTSASFRTIGFFVDTVPVRFVVNDTKTFAEQNLIIKAEFENSVERTLPFDKIVEIVKPERVPGLNPFFQICFSWINNFTIPLDLDGIAGDRICVPNGISPFDITFYMWEEKDIIKGEIEYNTDILKQGTIHRLIFSLNQMVDSVTKNTKENISEISIVSDLDDRLTSSFNNTQVIVPDCLIHDLFERQAKLGPQNTALISGESTLTYKQLDDRSNQLAGYLIKQGVRSGDKVGICLDRSAEMVISVLAILKSGGCYLPMDPGFPADRLNYMFEDSETRVIITHSSLKSKVTDFPKAFLLVLDEEKESIDKINPDKPAVAIDPDSLCYIIYTSGSTGKPKGVKVHHRAVVNLIQSMTKVPGITKEDRLLAVVTLSFDMSVYELFLTLSNGARLIMASSQDVTDGPALLSLIEKHDVSIIQATPSFWNILLSNGWKGKKNIKALCGGEALTVSLVRQILPRVKEFWNCYGPTETTVYSTCFQVTDQDADILIGKPIENTTIHILDKNNKSLPVGIFGEVAIGGLGVTKGYHAKPELTSEKFINYRGEGIIYKTGDQGRYLNDGNIELLGRIDNQVKLRGFRIEPGEIETLISALPNVMEVVVKIHKFDENDFRLVAFLNTEDENNLSKEEISGYLSKHLPPYMIPSFYQYSAGFPRLPNGKINKKALNFEIKEPDKDKKVDLGNLSAVRKRLMELWQNVLKISDIGVSDNFFNIGGNSLLAISLVDRIEKEFKIGFNFREFINGPTIQNIDKLIESKIVPVKTNDLNSTSKISGDKKIVKGEL